MVLSVRPGRISKALKSLFPLIGNCLFPMLASLGCSRPRAGVSVVGGPGSRVLGFCVGSASREFCFPQPSTGPIVPDSHLESSPVPPASRLLQCHPVLLASAGLGRGLTPSCGCWGPAICCQALCRALFWRLPQPTCPVLRICAVPTSRDCLSGPAGLLSPHHHCAWPCWWPPSVSGPPHSVQ